MSRAQGKHTPRQVLAGLAGAAEPELTEGERREAGIGDPRDIPGGLNHLANPPVRQQAVPRLERDHQYRRALLAHGVPPDEAGYIERDPRLTGAVNTGVEPKLSGPPPAPDPVPVYIVELASGPRPRAVSGTRHFTLPAAGSEPVQIVDEDAGRSLVQILNEDSSHNARFGQLSDLAYDAQNSVVVGGARLPAGATGYTVLRTQGPLWAISETSSTVVISVITEFQIVDVK